MTAWSAGLWPAQTRTADGLGRGPHGICTEVRVHKTLLAGLVRTLICADAGGGVCNGGGLLDHRDRQRSSWSDPSGDSFDW